MPQVPSLIAVRGSPPMRKPEDETFRQYGWDSFAPCPRLLRCPCSPPSSSSAHRSKRWSLLELSSEGEGERFYRHAVPFSRPFLRAAHRPRRHSGPPREQGRQRARTRAGARHYGGGLHAAGADVVEYADLVGRNLMARRGCLRSRRRRADRPKGTPDLRSRRRRADRPRKGHTRPEVPPRAGRRPRRAHPT